MRTRALLHILFGYLILAALLAVDLIAHGYRALQGVSFEFLRAVMQGVALSWLVRGAHTLLFRASTVSRVGESADAVLLPVRLIRRFMVVLGVVLVLSLIPLLFRLSLTREYVPTTFTTVISIDLMGSIWFAGFTLVLLSFWQLTFVRQQNHFARRRFARWALAAGCFSLFYFLLQLEIVGEGAVGVAILAALAAVVVLTSILLGYRLPWLPHVSRLGKRQLLWLSGASALLGAALLVAYGGAMDASRLLKDYAPFWRDTIEALLGTITIYFALVFFSALFSLSSTELVERKSAEVKSLAKLTRFSSDVLTSELLLDLPRLAEQITSLAREATGADAAWLELKSNVYTSGKSNAEDVTVRSQVGIDEASAERLMASSNQFPEVGKQHASPREELSQTSRALLLRRKLRDLADGQSGTDLHSLVAVPLLRRNEVRGGLYVGKRKEDGFDDDDLTVLTAFSDVASLALETARLLADSIEKQKFDGELRAARAMQRSLLPERFPDVPGFDIDAISIPAYDVGGDYYDSSVLWDGSALIVIGDVSGKGISASLYMAETKGVVQALAPLTRRIPELLEGANTALLRNSQDGGSMRRSFVTLGVISFMRGGVKYARAGHTPLLVVRADGSHEFVQPKGMAVGLIRQTLFNQMLEEREISVAPGDVLVLFSDGITDSRNPDGEEYGYHRLAEIVVRLRGESSAKRITLEVLNDVSLFASSPVFGDDATLVVMRGTPLDDGVR